MNGPSRKQWQQESGERQRARKAALDLASAMKLLRASAVAAERLTHSAEWDAYLRQGEAIQSADRAQVEAIQAQLVSGGYLDERALARLRHDVSRLQARIEAREELLKLPGEILRSVRSCSESAPAE